MDNHRTRMYVPKGNDGFRVCLWVYISEVKDGFGVCPSMSGDIDYQLYKDVCLQRERRVWHMPAGVCPQSERQVWSTSKYKVNMV